MKAHCKLTIVALAIFKNVLLAEMSSVARAIIYVFYDM